MKLGLVIKAVLLNTIKVKKKLIADRDHPREMRNLFNFRHLLQRHKLLISV